MPVRNLPGRFPALARLIMAHRPVVGSYGRRFMKSCATWVMCRGGTLPWKPAGPGERNGSAPLRPSWWLALLWQILLMLLSDTDPSSAVRASLKRPNDEVDDGVAHGWQAWVRRWSVDSFFPASLW